MVPSAASQNAKPAYRKAFTSNKLHTPGSWVGSCLDHKQSALKYAEPDWDHLLQRVLVWLFRSTPQCELQFKQNRLNTAGVNTLKYWIMQSCYYSKWPNFLTLSCLGSRTKYLDKLNINYSGTIKKLTDSASPAPLALLHSHYTTIHTTYSLSLLYTLVNHCTH